MSTRRKYRSKTRRLAATLLGAAGLVAGWTPLASAGQPCPVAITGVCPAPAEFGYYQTQWRRWPNPAAQGDTPPPPGFPAPAGTPGHESIDKRDERRVAPEAPRAMSAAPMAAGVLNGMTMPAVETPVYEGPLTSEPQPEMDGPLEVPKSVPELPATNEEASVAPPPTAPEVPPVAVAAPQPHSSRRTTSRVAAATSNAAEIVVGDQPPVRHAANNAAVALAGDNASDANPLRATNSLGSPNPLR